jgi:hypothetical protein
MYEISTWSRRAILPLSVAFVFFAIIVAGALTFALGRAIDITTSWTFETRLYDEVPVFGDLFDDADPQGTFIDTSVSIPYCIDCWIHCILTLVTWIDKVTSALRSYFSLFNDLPLH